MPKVALISSVKFYIALTAIIASNAWNNECMPPSEHMTETLNHAHIEKLPPTTLFEPTPGFHIPGSVTAIEIGWSLVYRIHQIPGNDRKPP